MSDQPRIYDTEHRRRIREVMSEHGPVSAAGLASMLGWSRKSAGHILREGAKLGLWAPCEAAPGAFHLTED